MKGNIEERACELATYIIENRTTVRDAAKNSVSAKALYIKIYRSVSPFTTEACI